MKRISYITSDFETWKSEFNFKHSVVVRFSETDMFGHMNNTVPFTYFEEARIQFLYHIGMREKWFGSANSCIPVVADLQCDFIRQVYFEQKLNIYVKVNQIGRSSIDLHYLALNEQNEPCFVGRGTLVQISKETGKSVPWTSEDKGKLSQTLPVID